MLGEMTPEALLGWVRLLVLVACFGGAARLDQLARRVPNSWWFSWAQPALLCLVVELLLAEAHWTVWATASAGVAFASTALIGRPTLRDIQAGSRVDIFVTIWYMISGVGFIMGGLAAIPDLMEYHMLWDPARGDAYDAAFLWMRMASIFVVVGFFELAWRFGMLHGGADAKAMMFVAILAPSWAGMEWPVLGEGLETALPPAIALLIWGGLAFLALPVIMLMRNARAGDASNFKMAWHAFRMPLADVPNQHVWVLEAPVSTPDGETSIETMMRPSRGGRSEDDLAALLAELAEAGREKVWVTAKYPLLLFLAPAVIPLAIWGDPVTTILGALGLI